MSNASENRSPAFAQAFAAACARSLREFETIQELDGVVIIPLWKPGIAVGTLGVFIRRPVQPETILQVSQAIGQAAPVVLEEVLEQLFQQSAATEQSNGKDPNLPRG